MPKRLPPKPCLILIMGVAGSGKSTLARGILRHIAAVYLDNNQIADSFFPGTRNGAAYKKSRPGFYKALYRIADENLQLGNSVLLDVPHVKEMRTDPWRVFIKRLARKNKAKLVCVRCRCSEPTLRSRLRSRGERRDGWKIEHWGEFLKDEPIEAPIPFAHLEIDTEKPLAKNVRAAVRYIRRRAAGREHGA